MAGFTVPATGGWKLHQPEIYWKTSPSSSPLFHLLKSSLFRPKAYFFRVKCPLLNLLVEFNGDLVTTRDVSSLYSPTSLFARVQLSRVKVVCLRGIVEK